MNRYYIIITTLASKGQKLHLRLRYLPLYDYDNCRGLMAVLKLPGLSHSGVGRPPLRDATVQKNSTRGHSEEMSIPSEAQRVSDVLGVMYILSNPRRTFYAIAGSC